MKLDSPPSTALPPGQHRIDPFPRFGVDLKRPPPAVPVDPVIEIGGAVTESFTFALVELSSLPRRELTADFHCVAGWTATDVRWEGVGFETFYRTVIEPMVAPDGCVTHLVFEGLDGYRSVVLADDALCDDVLIADHLDGRPLDGDHGAPARLVSPSQYGYISTKHLCRIELYTSRPTVRYHRSLIGHLALQLVKPHGRARVAHEERHHYLPGWLVRPLYRRTTSILRSRGRRGVRR